MLIASVKQIILSADLTSDLQQGHSLVWGGGGGGQAPQLFD